MGRRRRSEGARILCISGGKAEGNIVSGSPLSQSFDEKWMTQIDRYSI
jgi:hypothetical protein